MTSSSPPENPKIAIRPIQHNDLEAVEKLIREATEVDSNSSSLAFIVQLQQIREWYGLLMCLSWFPNPSQHDFCIYVAEIGQQIGGVMKVSPFNRTRSTWRVEQVLVSPHFPTIETGSGLLRHGFETIWEARTWLLEVNIHQKNTLGLYRHNGFQPLAQLTYWKIAPQELENLAAREPDLPNLLPVSNADAQLIYQLDTASMPPLVRQVFDRHLQDFKTTFLRSLIEHIQQWIEKTDVVSAYVFEPQRKAAIGYFQLKLSRDGSRVHKAQLTVHPAYTYLYPELLCQMARIVQSFPKQSLKLASADYQPEREEYLEQIGAQRIEQTLLMSRSVWHKLRESKRIDPILSDVFHRLQPARTPIPSRISWWESLSHEIPAGSMLNGSEPSSKSPNPLSKEINPPNDSPDIQN